MQSSITFQEVLDLVEYKKEEFARLPLFEYMRDTSIHPRQRLVFAPCIVPLAMGFGDLCKYVFKEEPTTDPLQQLINRHCDEEHFHWQWLLEDIEKLELNPSQSYTNSSLFIFGTKTVKTRQVCPKIERYAFHAKPIYKLAAILVAEVTANVYFEVSKPLALELQSLTQKEYRYFGGCHMGKEESHEINEPDIINFISNIQLSEAERTACFEIVEAVFEAYSDSMNEFLNYAQGEQYSGMLQVA
jgi:hypothetical protein